MTVLPKIVLAFCVLWISGVFSKIRIPPNPCPDVFTYYKNPKSEDIYGQAVVPYDGSNKLEFGVNASLIGYFNKADLRVHLINTPSYATQYKELRYNIFFPFSNVIPRITQIKYNDGVFCSGPQEALVAGGPGVTNVWAGHIYSYGTLSNRDQHRQGDTPSPVVPEQIDGTSDEELAVKDPNASHLNDNFQATNPFFSKKNPNSSPPPSVPSSPSPSKPVPETSKEEVVSVQNNMKEQQEITTNNGNFQCGVSKNSIVSLILGGEELTDGLFPWLVAMFVSKGNSYEYKCTANLVSDRHVVTAARCVQFHKVQIVPNEDMLFVFGRSDISRWATNGAVTRGAKKIETHPEYDQNSAHGDVTVITLDKPVDFNRNIAPVCLWEGKPDLEEVIDSKGTTAGWGMEDKSKKKTYSIPKARYVDMPIVSQENCLYSNFTFGTITSDMTFCAGERNGSGPCIGDSGAGFMIKRSGKYHLRGIVSIALGDIQGTCDLNHFVVFCDVAKCKDWIEKVITS